ncbi:MAG: DNA adenine methylase [Kiritimatiellae bacterium]|nr:DNA adenine methylase [Kiritimatiellia bacterium]
MAATSATAWGFVERKLQVARSQPEFNGGNPPEENSGYLTTQILTYLGNKRSLLKHIGIGIAKVKGEIGRDRLAFFDAFSGSGIVSRYMKRHASLIVANDMEHYSEVVNRCYLTNKESVDYRELDEIYRSWVDYTQAHLTPGIISKLYAPKDSSNIKMGERVFYTRENALLLDSARAALDHCVPKRYFNLFLAPLLAEASIHPNTSGVFKGFYKNRCGVGAFGGEGKNALPRIFGKVRLQKPVLSNFSCDSIVMRGDTNRIVNEIPEVDLAYFDPPYNQHPYGSNYFMLNLLVDNKEPEHISKVSGIPAGWNHSKYNIKAEAEETFFELLRQIKARYLLISYNSEGFIRYDRFISFLSSIGFVSPVEIEYNTFRGSRNLRNRAIKVKEYLFLVKKA